MVVGLQLPFSSLPLGGMSGKQLPMESEMIQPLSFGDLLKLKEKQLQQEQQVSAASIAAALAALQTSVVLPLPVLNVELDAPQPFVDGPTQPADNSIQSFITSAATQPTTARFTSTGIAVPVTQPFPTPAAGFAPQPAESSETQTTPPATVDSFKQKAIAKNDSTSVVFDQSAPEVEPELVAIQVKQSVSTPKVEYPARPAILAQGTQPTVIQMQPSAEANTSVVVTEPAFEFQQKGEAVTSSTSQVVSEAQRVHKDQELDQILFTTSTASKKVSSTQIATDDESTVSLPQPIKDSAVIEEKQLSTKAGEFAAKSASLPQTVQVKVSQPAEVVQPIQQQVAVNDSAIRMETVKSQDKPSRSSQPASAKTILTHDRETVTPEAEMPRLNTEVQQPVRSVNSRRPIQPQTAALSTVTSEQITVENATFTTVTESFTKEVSLPTRTEMRAQAKVSEPAEIVQPVQQQVTVNNSAIRIPNREAVHPNAEASGPDTEVQQPMRSVNPQRPAQSQTVVQSTVDSEQIIVESVEFTTVTDPITKEVSLPTRTEMKAQAKVSEFAEIVQPVLQQATVNNSAIRIETAKSQDESSRFSQSVSAATIPTPDHETITPEVERPRPNTKVQQSVQRADPQRPTQSQTAAPSTISSEQINFESAEFTTATEPMAKEAPLSTRAEIKAQATITESKVPAHQTDYVSSLVSNSQAEQAVVPDRKPSGTVKPLSASENEPYITVPQTNETQPGEKNSRPIDQESETRIASTTSAPSEAVQRPAAEQPLETKENIFVASVPREAEPNHAEQSEIPEQVIFESNSRVNQTPAEPLTSHEVKSATLPSDMTRSEQNKPAAPAVNDDENPVSASYVKTGNEVIKPEQHVSIKQAEAIEEADTLNKAITPEVKISPERPVSVGTTDPNSGPNPVRSSDKGFSAESYHAVDFDVNEGQITQFAKNETITSEPRSEVKSEVTNQPHVVRLEPRSSDSIESAPHPSYRPEMQKGEEAHPELSFNGTITSEPRVEVKSEVINPTREVRLEPRSTDSVQFAPRPSYRPEMQKGEEAASELRLNETITSEPRADIKSEVINPVHEVRLEPRSTDSVQFASHISNEAETQKDEEVRPELKLVENASTAEEVMTASVPQADFRFEGTANDVVEQVSTSRSANSDTRDVTSTTNTETEEGSTMIRLDQPHPKLTNQPAEQADEITSSNIEVVDEDAYTKKSDTPLATNAEKPALLTYAETNPTDKVQPVLHPFHATVEQAGEDAMFDVSTAKETSTFTQVAPASTSNAKTDNPVRGETRVQSTTYSPDTVIEADVQAKKSNTSAPQVVPNAKKFSTEAQEVLPTSRPVIHAEKADARQTIEVLERFDTVTQLASKVDMAQGNTKPEELSVESQMVASKPTILPVDPNINAPFETNVQPAVRIESKPTIMRSSEQEPLRAVSEQKVTVESNKFETRLDISQGTEISRPVLQMPATEPELQSDPNDLTDNAEIHQADVKEQRPIVKLASEQEPLPAVYEQKAAVETNKVEIQSEFSQVTDVPLPDSQIAGIEPELQASHRKKMQNVEAHQIDGKEPKSVSFAEISVPQPAEDRPEMIVPKVQGNHVSIEKPSVHTEQLIDWTSTGRNVDLDGSRPDSVDSKEPVKTIPESVAHSTEKILSDSVDGKNNVTGIQDTIPGVTTAEVKKQETFVSVDPQVDVAKQVVSKPVENVGGNVEPKAVGQEGTHTIEQASVRTDQAAKMAHDEKAETRRTVSRDEETRPIEKRSEPKQMSESTVAATGLINEAKAAEFNDKMPIAQIHAQATEVVQQVIRQISSRIKSGSTSMRLQLNPQELGSIEVEMVSSSHGVQVTFFAEQASTGRLLETQLNQLRDSLVDSGVQLSGLNIGHHNTQGQKGGTFNQEPNAAPWPNEIFVEESRTIGTETSTSERRFGQSSEVDYRI